MDDITQCYEENQAFLRFAVLSVNKTLEEYESGSAGIVLNICTSQSHGRTAELLTDCVSPAHTARITHWSRTDTLSSLANAPHTFVDDWLEMKPRPQRPRSVFWNMWMNPSFRNSDSIYHNETYVFSHNNKREI